MDKDREFKAQDFTGAWMKGKLKLDEEGNALISVGGGLDIYVREETVCAITGLKCGEYELFEHDLVDVCGDKFEVVYNKKNADFALLNLKTQELGQYPITYYLSMYNCKLIGNIFDFYGNEGV